MGFGNKATRPAISDFERLRLEAAGDSPAQLDKVIKDLAKTHTHQQIAKELGVTRQAVTLRLSTAGQSTKGRKSVLWSVLPWDISEHPQKQYFYNQASFTGLRAFISERQGEAVSARRAVELKRFKELHLAEGEVVHFDVHNGFVYRPREASDRGLVVRWPSDKPLPDPDLLRLILLVDPRSRPQ